MNMDPKIIDIVDKAMAGGRLDAQEIAALYGLDTFSKEAYYVMWAGRVMSQKASSGLAEIHAQIGLNAAPCPKNCQFCSFAACNKLRKNSVVTPLADVLEYAKIYEDQGVNAMLMLITASFPFERFLEITYEVRQVISQEMPLLANVDDFTLEQAKQLKQAGINGVYHAVRMGEGVVTGIKPEVRMATIAAAKEVGLKLCTCVEPVGPEHTVEELVEATLRSRDLDAVFSGVGKRITVPGSKLEEYGMLSESRAALLVAVYRLASGYDCALNCSGHSVATANAGANIAWAEVGTNPRDLMDKTENGGRGHGVEELQKMYASSEWEVRKGFSPYWN